MHRLALRFLRAARSRLLQAGAACSGAIAVEFALIMPILLTMVIGTVSVVQYIRASIVFTKATATMAEITAAQTLVTGGSAGILGDYCKGAQFTMYGYNPASLSMAVASVTNTNGTIAEDWQNSNICPTVSAGFGSGGIPTSVSLASALVPTAGDSVIVVRATYTYTPLFNLIIGSPLTMTEYAYGRPRNYSVSCSSGCTSG